jgi:alanine-glyoxylate transaminase/serine-glyoxylate transaminase/serine-pyruvate transaminase
LKPLKVNKRIILGPGPSSANPEVLKSLSNPILGYLDPDFFSILDEVRNNLKNLYRTNDNAFALTGSGSSGMEAGLTCLAERGDKVIICSYGYFCERQILMAERLELNIIPIRTEWGKQMDPSLLEDALRENPDTQLVVATHAETSTGVLQNIEELGKIVSKSDAFFMVDCVTSIAGIELLFDDWNMDYAYSGSQKCLASPPGLSPCALSDKAYQYIKNRKTKPSSWYLDLSLVNDYWSEDHIPQYTVAVSSIYGLYESLRLLEEEGIENRWTRHRENAEKLCKGLLDLELKLPISENDRLNQLTVVSKPDHIDDVDFRNKLIYDYNVEIGRGLGDFSGKVFRIGLMGESCKSEYVDLILDIFSKEI